MRISRRNFFFRPVKLRHKGTFLFIGAIVLLFVWGCRGIHRHLEPAIETLARSSAVNRMTKTVSEAVASCISGGQWNYGDFVITEASPEGRIISLTSDLAAVSLMKQQVELHLAEELGAVKEESFGVPLGTLTGWMIFSGKGPTVRVELLSVGDLDLQVRHGFREAGINQTQHQIFLDVSAAIHLMIPGKILEESVCSSVCIAETIIIGEVPDTYLNFGNGE